ncbi:hypothetical protein MG293_000317 [Ovis ammon polii]|uniref:Uncharacterized protein n=1 Tax=Ovis ammon polii TaxID=230172 RepID=A0AAD4UNL0_OVIAM|nr:hypothetical protein MG293_000317 [Ovis ammon polii]
MATRSSTLAWEVPWTEEPEDGKFKIKKVANVLSDMQLPLNGDMLIRYSLAYSSAIKDFHLEGNIGDGSRLCVKTGKSGNECIHQVRVAQEFGERNRRGLSPFPPLPLSSLGGPLAHPVKQTVTVQHPQKS